MIISCDTCTIRKTCKEFLKGFQCYHKFTIEQLNKKEDK